MASQTITADTVHVHNYAKPRASAVDALTVVDLERHFERLVAELRLQPVEPLVDHADREDRGRESFEGLGTEPPLEPVPELHTDSSPLRPHTPLTVEDRPVAAEPEPQRSATPLDPYFADELVTLYHGDCLKHPELWTRAAVLITDPPYGLEALAGGYGFSSSKRGTVTIANDRDTTTRDRALELWGTKPVACFATPRLPEPPGQWVDRLVWDKGMLGLNKGPWRYAHESIFVRGEGWTRRSDAASSILRHSTAKNRRHVADHIHSKPVPLLEELILCAPPGLIADPFAGGGATVDAARLLGRQVVAFELDERYCEVIAKRLSQQSFLFPDTD